MKHGEEKNYALIKQRQEEYVQLTRSPFYKDIYFNKDTGALRATHIEHHFDAEKGYYEEDVTALLYQEGHKIILESERNGEGIKTPDGILNDTVFEIKTVEGSGANNIKNKFNEARSQGCSSIVLYFPDPDMYSYVRIQEGYRKYKGVIKKEKLNNPLQNIWIVVNKGIIVFK